MTPVGLRLKLKYDEPLSDFALNCNLRPYTMVEYDMSDSMRIGVAVTNCTALLEVGPNKYALQRLYFLPILRL